MRYIRSTTLIQHTQTIPTSSSDDQMTFPDKFRVQHTEMLRLLSLPKPDDVVRFLDAAREAAEDSYQGPEYLHVREALLKVFDNCIEWLDEGIEPNLILLEALQDERAIVDRHNWTQAKAHPRQDKHWSIPEEMIHFPLRSQCLSDGHIKLPPSLFKPIYQVEEDLNSPTPSSSGQSFLPKRYNAGKLVDAPSPTHNFPDGNSTLAEIAAFLPQSIKSWDVADRIIWNGATSEDLAIMFNKHRNLSPNIDTNSVYLMFRGQMRKRTEAEHGYKNWKKWTVKAQAAVVKPNDFDPHSISVTGFRRPVIFQNRPDVPADPIPFMDLAKGVAVWPEGYDALDLTRCVRWCADHPETEFYYPTDYQTVLRIVGPLRPDPFHADAHALARLRSVTGRTVHRRRLDPCHDHDNVKPDGEDDGVRSIERKPSNLVAVRDSGRRQSTTTASAQQDRKAHRIKAQPPARTFAELEIDPEVDTDDDAYQGPKRMKKNKDAPRRSGRNMTRSIWYVDDDGANVEENSDENEQTREWE